MAKNSIERQKSYLKGGSIAFIILGLCGLGGGLALIICNIIGMTTQDPNWVLNILLLILGAVILVFGCIGIGLGIKWLWVSTAIKATNGSIADENLCKGTVNGRVCPKCGCTNTGDVTKCQSCGADLNFDPKEN